MTGPQLIRLITLVFLPALDDLVVAYLTVDWPQISTRLHHRAVVVRCKGMRTQSAVDGGVLNVAAVQE